VSVHERALLVQDRYASLCGILAERMRLATERLALREFLVSDGERVYAIESDPESVVYQSFGPRTREESRDYARRHSLDQQRQERDTWDLVVTLHGTDEMIGRCGLGLTGNEPGEALLWYQFDRAVWGRGYATEAARAVAVHSPRGPRGVSNPQATSDSRDRT
jgi:RimJ/RimL family protein N-acetyltransferase